MEQTLCICKSRPSPELQPPPASLQPKLVNFDPKVYRQKQKDGLAETDLHD